MKSIKEYDQFYSVIEGIISSADPAALGGTSGEYDNQVNEIIRYILEKKMPIGGKLLLEMFLGDFPDCNVSAPEEFARIANEINAKVL